jgi:hypothetical protein
VKGFGNPSDTAIFASMFTCFLTREFKEKGLILGIIWFFISVQSALAFGVSYLN